MKRPIESPSPQRDASSPGDSGSKRRYQTPSLVEYGSVGKLTQGGSGTFAEVTKNMQTMGCL